MEHIYGEAALVSTGVRKSHPSTVFTSSFGPLQGLCTIASRTRDALSCHAHSPRRSNLSYAPLHALSVPIRRQTDSRTLFIHRAHCTPHHLLSPRSRNPTIARTDAVPEVACPIASVLSHADDEGLPCCRPRPAHALPIAHPRLLPKRRAQHLPQRPAPLAARAKPVHRHKRPAMRLSRSSPSPDAVRPV
ncbi:hypothetical protein C8J57DRAFT_621578 [Mycena rebaudengoi]|nr:hypothetical protein C8J57DRAFT_621578 [Mycena rebaudengoi]